MTAWVVRARRRGEHERWFLDYSVEGGGWNVGVLGSATDRQSVGALVEAAYPGEAAVRTRNWTSQLASFRAIQPGDLVLTPVKSKGALALGACRDG